ncbi:MAG: adenosine deaminase [Ignavibacteriaceae bacterium]|nr:adenosine deaminase [Ignavibacteriaceae bacterium]
MVIAQYYLDTNMLKDKKNTDAIIEMPKAEIHLHLEGAFTFDFLFELIQKNGGDPGISSIEDLKKKFVFKDFSHFIQTWLWKNKFYRKPEDFEESAYQTIKNLSLQNVMYAEVFFSPWDFISQGMKIEEITEATISGIRRAEREYLIKCNLIADIVRNYGAETSIQRLNQITPYLNKGVIGIGLGGSEKEFPAVLFKEVFIEAKKRGFRTTVHAGEAAGAESVWSAILDLHAERIGHGVRAIEDPKLIGYLLEKQIPLEVCITSNIKTKVFDNLMEHPFDYMYKKGLNVSVNSDDPPMFGADITDELTMLYNKLDYSLNDLKTLTKKAIEASFLETSEKKKYSDKVDNYLKNN